MSGEKNLIPMNKRTVDEQKRITTMGGKASGEARRKKRDLKNIVNLMMNADLTDEQKKKMSIALTGKKQSEETKQKKREKESGVNNAFYGKKHDYETRKKMSIPITQYTLEGKFVRDWIGAMEVKHVLGYNQGCITACCRGRQKTAYGFKWAYKNPPLLKKNEGLNKN